ncbi:Unknown protein [Striga hermonthica]|uniref:Uncharacterized protein n=1 Tax=Striga hermonthica TaxID=68872 RepID=A0A9N7RJG0_STRHE|nr:Unknown protein [Striga hermonthica]
MLRSEREKGFDKSARLCFEKYDDLPEISSKFCFFIKKGFEIVETGKELKYYKCINPNSLRHKIRLASSNGRRIFPAAFSRTVTSSISRADPMNDFLAGMAQIQDGMNELRPMNDLLAGMAQIQNGMNELRQRVDAIDNRMDASIRSKSARAANKNMKDHRLVPLPKLIGGHPWPDPGHLDGVKLQGQYPVGSDPPAGLLPTCGTEVDRMSMEKDKTELTQRLKAIYWFYNDPRLGIFKLRNLMDFLLEEP